MGCDLWCFNMSCFFLERIVIKWFLQFGELPYDFCDHGHILCIVSHFYFGVGHQGLPLIIPLQMDKEFACPPDTAEIPQSTGFSLGKKLGLFLIIVKLFKKVVFLGKNDRGSVV